MEYGCDSSHTKLYIKPKRNDTKKIFFSKSIFNKIILKYVKKHTNNRMVTILKCVRKLTDFRMREKCTNIKIKGDTNNGK